MDYAALAKQYGGTSAPPIDYAALAAQFGAVDPLAARVAKIPGGATQAPAATKPERSAIDVLGGVLETPLALTSGADAANGHADCPRQRAGCACYAASERCGNADGATGGSARHQRLDSTQPANARHGCG